MTSRIRWPGPSAREPGDEGDGDDTELLELLSGDGDLRVIRWKRIASRAIFAALKVPSAEQVACAMAWMGKTHEPHGIGRILGMSRDRATERDGLASPGE